MRPLSDQLLHGKPDSVRRRKKRDPRWDDESFHWSWSMWAEYHMHDREHCRGFYGHVKCMQVHNLAVVDG